MASASRKRGLGTGDNDQPRPASAAPAPDRVTLQVGTETFVTSKATLEPASSYFARLFAAEWATTSDDRMLFLDRDADAFRVLLSFMRTPHISVLPREPGLFARVLLDAEYLGIDSLIHQVKAQVQRHLHQADHRFARGIKFALSDEEKEAIQAEWTPEAFDEEHGGLHEALRCPWFIERVFTPAPETQETMLAPPKIKQLLPARSGERVVIAKGFHEMFVADRSRSVRAYALVESVEGHTSVLPVVATIPSDRRDAEDDDETEEDLALQPLELITELDYADAYGWYMAGREEDVKPHGNPY